MSDVIDRLFGGEAEQDVFYPGSRHKRRPLVEKPEEVDPWRNHFTHMKVVNDKYVRMYTIGALAEALGVSVPSIRKWTAAGRIPKAPYRLPPNMIVKGEQAEGRRLYTEPIIDAAVEVFRRNGILNKPRIQWKNHESIPVQIYEAWVRVLETAPQDTGEADLLDDDYIDYTSKGK